MGKRFVNKVALVTGAGSGIGSAVAMAFAREGAKVVVADVSVEGGAMTVKMVVQGGGDATFLKTDVSSETGVRTMVEKTIELYGRIDCACNNAGVKSSEVFTADCSEEDWDRVMNIDLKGQWLCMKHEIPIMTKQGGGAIVNISSIAAFKATPRMVEYSTAKAGTINLTKTAAVEYARQGVRVNAVCPGMIITPMSDGGANRAFDWNKLAGELVPMGRRARPEEVAEAVLWLCSEAASYVTGVALPVDGGILAG